jgi:hypothetical protein
MRSVAENTRFEFAGDVSRIAHADAEAQQRAGRVPDLQLELIEVLVRALHKPLKWHSKNGDGSFRGPFAPPVALTETFSLPIRQPKKRVISKALTGWSGYRPRSLRPIFPLFLAVFSAGWELHQFSTQLGF